MTLIYKVLFLPISTFETPPSVDRLARLIEHLGYWVHLEPVAAPAA